MTSLVECGLEGRPGGAATVGPLAECVLGPFLQAARRRGDEVLVVGPAAMADLVAVPGFAFAAGGEPREVEVAPIRERLPSAPPEEASVLGNRELFGRLAARALLPAMTSTCERWKPDLVLRDPCEHASASVAARLDLRVAQVAISSHPLPDWWGGDRSPLVYVTFGTVLGHMAVAAGVYPRLLDPLPDGVHAERWVDQERVLPAAEVVVCHGGSGTVYGALAAGAPLVVVPVFADQFENGRRVEAAGAGVVVEVDGGSRARVVDERDAPRIQDAIETVLATPDYQHRERAIAATMAGAPPADQVLDAMLGR